MERKLLEEYKDSIAANTIFMSRKTMLLHLAGRNATRLEEDAIGSRRRSP